MSRVTASVHDVDGPEARCRRECASTWASDYGASVPGGPFPGTRGGPGDVRRCEHGQVWAWTDRTRGYFGNLFDRWERLSPWSTRRRYRAAVRALAAAGHPGRLSW